MTDTPTPPLMVKCEIEVPLERVVNCIIGFCESPYSPWAKSFLPQTASPKESADEGIWYSVERFWQSGGRAELIYDDPREPEGAFGATVSIGMVQLTNGLNIMATKAPRHFADLVAEEDDAITHDVFMQMVVFGEIIYG